MDWPQALRAGIVQALLAGTVFLVLLLLPLREDFFEDWGFVVGPLAWIAASIGTMRILGLSSRRAALAATAGGLVALAAVIVGAHTAGSPAAVAAFALVAGYRK